jgi:predicted ATPase
MQDGPGGQTYIFDAPVAGDPHMHAHNFLMNLVVTAEGRIGSLNTRAFTDVRIKEFGAYFQAVLADELRRIGVRVGYDEGEQAVVLLAIPDEISKAFSKRDKQILHKAKRFAESQGLEWEGLSADRKLKIVEEASAEGRLGKMKTDEKRMWREQAEALGWRHATALEGATYEKLTDEQRVDRAYEFAARHLAEEFRTAATITHEKLGLYATRGLIGVGISGGPDDIRRVVELIEERGIRLRGEHVALVTGMMDGMVRVTNTAQIRIEQKVTALAREGARDRSGALSMAAVRDAVDRTGVAFTAEQRAAIHALGEGGRMTLLTGVAGAGKTTLLQPLVDAWQSDRRFSQDGRQVVGVAMAWRQADALKDGNYSPPINFS